MTRVALLARGAVSALGVGSAAWSVGLPGEAARSEIRRDPALADAGLARPLSARAPSDLGIAAFDDRASGLLAAALEQLCTELDEQWPEWRSRRIGVAIGTSSGGMLSAERWFALRAAGEIPSASLLRQSTYFAPFCDALGWVGIDVGDGAGGPSPTTGPLWHHVARVVPVCATQIVAACASSTIAMGVGLRWLARGGCDLVLAGGYDGLSLFVAAGFEAIRATTGSRPRPFRMDRDGMSLGEGAGMVALAAADARTRTRAHAFVTGFGASNDAVHITAPDRTGAGLARAANGALREAGAAPVDLVSAHATSTPYNDAMEAKAIAAACGADAMPVVHPFKAQIGHTLGAAGVLESLAALDCLQRGIAPAAAGDGELDPEAAVVLLAAAEHRPIARVLKLSAAFAGVTAAVVLDRNEESAALSGNSTPADGPLDPSHRPATGGGPETAAPAPLREVFLRGHARVSEVDLQRLMEATGLSRDRIGRIDDIGQLALAAVERLVHRNGRASIDGAGVVIGHALATIDVNDRFHTRLRERGPRFVDPRLFPATTPNAAAGHVAIAFGLTGPNFAVNAGLSGGIEALAAGVELVAAGDADRILVLAADEAGPLARHWCERLLPADRPWARGAVALLLDAEPPAEGAPRVEVPVGIEPDHTRGPLGHLGLVQWLTEQVGDGATQA